jgi:MFS transporter, CP family, cyanate transporter
MALLGLGQGAIGDFAFMFIVLRSPDVRTSAALSSMAQTVGYLLAAAGPLAFGVLRDVTGGWTVPLVVAAVLLVPEAIAGLLAGRDRRVGRYEREHLDAEPVSGGPGPGDAGVHDGGAPAR